MRNNTFTRGLIIGGIIGATVGMMRKDNNFRMKRRLKRVGRSVINGRKGIVDVITDLF